MYKVESVKIKSLIIKTCPELAPDWDSKIGTKPLDQYLSYAEIKGILDKFYEAGSGAEEKGGGEDKE